MSKATKPSISELQAVVQSMINEANNWYAVSKRCLPDDPFGGLHIPGLVSNAFSIELYLKLLMIVQGDAPPAEHDYHKIFRKFPKNIQDKISNRFQAYWLYADNHLEDYIKETGKWFVDLRYHYERLAVWKLGDASTLPPHFNKHKYWNLTRALHFTVIEFAPHLDGDGRLSSMFPLGNSSFA